ncbi:hypothetical protein PPERSA_06473 [Pseudocohnilembus persalinus]|uniref:Uncharacterized protein n=1 Tax=Pseudocohnilembus persalinus TaxID=266149 RepID=A0A0V0QRU0_PSEPJ|nr:hypothetical protein PPERSA_06473 [Pseudocohnilembus persalinus]|eukprot:KRX04839.1 hypothetical protein PPERSA_06473 [Pseudocohnilembus persalinus]
MSLVKKISHQQFPQSTPSSPPRYNQTSYQHDYNNMSQDLKSTKKYISDFQKNFTFIKESLKKIGNATQNYSKELKSINQNKIVFIDQTQVINERFKGFVEGVSSEEIFDQKQVYQEIIDLQTSKIQKIMILQIQQLSKANEKVHNELGQALQKMIDSLKVSVSTFNNSLENSVNLGQNFLQNHLLSNDQINQAITLKMQKSKQSLSKEFLKSSQKIDFNNKNTVSYHQIKNQNSNKNLDMLKNDDSLQTTPKKQQNIYESPIIQKNVTDSKLCDGTAISKYIIESNEKDKFIIIEKDKNVNCPTDQMVNQNKEGSHNYNETIKLRAQNLQNQNQDNLQKTQQQDFQELIIQPVLKDKKVLDMSFCIIDKKQQYKQQNGKMQPKLIGVKIIYDFTFFPKQPEKIANHPKINFKNYLDNLLLKEEIEKNYQKGEALYPALWGVDPKTQYKGIGQFMTLYELLQSYEKGYKIYTGITYNKVSLNVLKKLGGQTTKSIQLNDFQIEGEYPFQENQDGAYVHIFDIEKKLIEKAFGLNKSQKKQKHSYLSNKPKL